jgi:hypothetical protein
MGKPIVESTIVLPMWAFPNFDHGSARWLLSPVPS